MKRNSAAEKTAVSKSSAADKENLADVSNLLRSDKHPTETKTKSFVPEKEKADSLKCKSVVHKDKAVQTTKEEVKLDVEDLTSTIQSEKYWELLAERRRKALEETLIENKELTHRVRSLHEYIEKLERESEFHEEMLNEARTLIEVLQNIIQDDENGINNSLEDNVL